MTNEEFRSKAEKSVQDSYRAIFDEYCGYVYSIVFNRLRSCGSREDIEECVGDVFSDVYRYLDSSHEGELSPFIGTVARRKAARYFNKLSSAKETVPLDEELTEVLRSDEDIENNAIKSEFQSLLIGKIKELGEPDSTIIIQKYYYNRTSKEISEIVSLSPQAIRTRSHRAVKKLKELLEKAGITL